MAQQAGAGSNGAGRCERNGNRTGSSTSRRERKIAVATGAVVRRRSVQARPGGVRYPSGGMACKVAGRPGSMCRKKRWFSTGRTAENATTH